MIARAAPDGLLLLVALRDALATPQGARLAREIRALLKQADDADEDSGSYAARVVARAFARTKQTAPQKANRPKRATNSRRAAAGAPSRLRSATHAKRTAAPRS